MDKSNKKRKSHKIITCKCSNCKNKINVSEHMENEDFEYINKNTLTVYCDRCGNEELIKL